MEILGFTPSSTSRGLNPHLSKCQAHDYCRERGLHFSPFLLKLSVQQRVQTVGSLEQSEQERMRFSTKWGIKVGSGSAPQNAYIFLQ